MGHGPSHDIDANKIFHGLTGTPLEKELNSINTFAPSTLKDLLSDAGQDIRANKTKHETADNLQFPSDLAAHAMVFHFKNSSMPKGDKRDMLNHTQHSISLPVPASLLDSTNTQYNELELGSLGGALSDVQSAGAIKKMATGVFTEAFEQGMYAADADFGAIKQNQGIATLALTNMIRKTSPAAQVGLARFFGSVPNPHLTALFKGVGLKNHSFSWRLSPASMQESLTLQNIIQTFKRAMLPTRTNQNLTLEFPDEVDIYIRGHVQNFHMFEFKTAVIKNVTINYAPDNIPSFFAGTGGPTHVDFKVDFLETTIHTRDHYPHIDLGIVDPPIGNPLVDNKHKGGGRPDSMGDKGFSSGQKPKIKNSAQTDSQDRGFGHVPPGAGQHSTLRHQQFKKNMDAGSNFGHTPAGAGAPNQKFIGKNPNIN